MLCFRRCLSVCLSVCLLATLRKKFRLDLREILRVGWQWANEQLTKCCWRSGIFRISNYWEIRKVVYHSTTMRDAAVVGMH